MRGWIKEFREFAIKGNVIDMAVGVIIGAAFGKIVSSLVSDVVMPPLGMLIGGIDFAHFRMILRGASDGQPEVAIRYGVFLQACLDFLIVSWSIFFAVKLINRLKRQETHGGATPPLPPPEVQLLSEIRDLLRNK